MRLRQRFFRVGRVVTVFVIGLLFAGSIYQYLAERQDLRLNPPPGDLVDIGGIRLHLHCIGSGSPTVVIEPGANDFSVGWTDIQSALSRRTRVCTYDRAGAGWFSSDGTGEPVNGQYTSNRSRRQSLHSLGQTRSHYRDDRRIIGDLGIAASSPLQPGYGLVFTEELATIVSIIQKQNFDEVMR